VIQEAKEKAFELDIKGLKEFENEKKSIVSAQSEAIVSEMENQFKQN